MTMQLLRIPFKDVETRTVAKELGAKWLAPIKLWKYISEIPDPRLTKFDILQSTKVRACILAAQKTNADFSIESCDADYGQEADLIARADGTVALRIKNAPGMKQFNSSTKQWEDMPSIQIHPIIEQYV